MAVTAAMTLIGIAHLMFAQETASDLRRMRNATEAEQTAWINAHLCAGMAPSEVFGDLVDNKSEVALPIIEQKIEEVLRSPAPSECFSDKSVDLQKFPHRAALAITWAGNVQSLKEASKLIRIDEKQFGWMVDRTLLQAESYRNPFAVAYAGFEIGDPALDSRIAAWVQVYLSDEIPVGTARGVVVRPMEEFDKKRYRGWWAEAMVEKYGAAPTESQWGVDPVVSVLGIMRSRILRDEVVRAASEAAQKRTRR
jgi:hypothetical protein